MSRMSGTILINTAIRLKRKKQKHVHTITINRNRIHNNIEKSNGKGQRKDITIRKYIYIYKE